MSWMDKLSDNWMFRRSQAVSVDTEELSVLELSARNAQRTDELIDKVKEFETDLTTKVDITDLEQNRKLSPEGDFTGTWNGLQPQETEAGLKASFQAHVVDNDTMFNTVRTEAISENRFMDRTIGSNVLKVANDADKIKLANLAQEVIQAMAGNTPVTAVPADLGITTGKYADASVIPSKTSFMIQNKNLFNKNAITALTAINTYDGTLQAHASYSTSDYIPVVAGQQYVRSSTIAGSNEDTKSYAWYNGQKAFISSGGAVAGEWVITAPANAQFLRITVNKPDGYQLEMGNVATAYGIYGFTVKDALYEASNNRNVPNGLAGLGSDGKLKRNYVGGIHVSKNLFDATKAQQGYAIDLITGNLLANGNGYYASDYMEVVAGLDYRVSGSQNKNYAWYDVNKTFISGASDLTNLKAPANACYLRTTIYPSDFPTYQVEQGTVQTSYEVFGVTLDNGNYVMQSNVGKPNGVAPLNSDGKIDSAYQAGNRWNGKIVNFIGDSITYGYSPIDGSQLANPYPKLVGSELAFGTVRNYGISGSTISQGDGTTNPMSTRYSTMDSNADIVGVLGGTNDWARGLALGTIADITNATFYGALNVLAKGLIEKYPHATIFFMTPMHREGDTGNTTPLSAFRQAILDIGLKYGLPVLDLYAKSGFYPDNATNKATICPDGRHPNDEGHVKLSYIVSGFIRSL